MLQTPLTPPLAPPGAMPPAPDRPNADALAALRRRLRRRAVAEALILAAAALAAGFLPADPHEGLLFGLTALSLGLLLFVVRRARDLDRLAGLVRAEQQALAGRGISLSEWQAGAPLPAWGRRG